jgi:hypothetical protein
MMRPVSLTLALCLLRLVGRVRGADVPSLAKATTQGDLWWHQMFSMSFDGHGNFVSPHLDKLHTTAASLGAVGYHGPWQAALARDMSWMRGHEQAFADYPTTKRVVYIEGSSAQKVFARVSADGRVLFTLSQLAELGDPKRRRGIESPIKPEGRTVWCSDWEFMQSPDLKMPLGGALPTAKDLGLPAFTNPLGGGAITKETDFWRTRSASALIGSGGETGEGIQMYVAIPDDMAEALGLSGITTPRADVSGWSSRQFECSTTPSSPAIRQPRGVVPWKC